MSQNWLIDRMQLAGYKFSKEGLCFGLAHMGMQAFLTHDLATFDQHLKHINEIPLNKFVDIFDYLKEKQIVDPDTRMLDILPFLDGINLYQSPDLYPHLFDKGQLPLQKSL